MKKRYYYMIAFLFVVVLAGCQNNDKEKSIITQNSALTVKEDSLGYLDQLNQLNLLELVNNQHDFNEAKFKITILTPPKNGTIEIEGGDVDFQGRIKDIMAYYSPYENYIGPDSYVYQVSNGKSTSTGTIEISVINVNDKPVAVGTKLTIYENSTITLDLSNLAYDEENSDLIFEIVDAPIGGTLIIDDSIITYTAGSVVEHPDIYRGESLFTYRVFDGVNYSNFGEIKIIILKENDTNTTSN